RPAAHHVPAEGDRGGERGGHAAAQQAQRGAARGHALSLPRFPAQRGSAHVPAQRVGAGSVAASPGTGAGTTITGPSARCSTARETEPSSVLATRPCPRVPSPLSWEVAVRSSGAETGTASTVSLVIVSSGYPPRCVSASASS